MTGANEQPATDGAPPAGASDTSTAGTPPVPTTTPPAPPPPTIPQGDLDLSQRYTKGMRCENCLDRKWYDCDFLTRMETANGDRPPCSNCRFYGGPNCRCRKGKSLNDSLYVEVVNKGKPDGSLIPPKLRQRSPMSADFVPAGWQGRRNPEGQPQLPPNLQGSNIIQRLGLTDPKARAKYTLPPNAGQTGPPQVVVHNFSWGHPPPWATYQPSSHPPHQPQPPQQPQQPEQQQWQQPWQQQEPQAYVQRQEIPPASAHPMQPQAPPPPPPAPARGEHALPPKPAKIVPPGERPASQRANATPLASSPTSPFHPGLKRKREDGTSSQPVTGPSQQHLPQQGTGGFIIKGAAQLPKRRRHSGHEEH